MKNVSLALLLPAYVSRKIFGRQTLRIEDNQSRTFFSEALALKDGDCLRADAATSFVNTPGGYDPSTGVGNERCASLCAGIPMPYAGIQEGKFCLCSDDPFGWCTPFQKLFASKSIQRTLVASFLLHTTRMDGRKFVSRNLPSAFLDLRHSIRATE